jgi:hypothetical protein
MMAENGDFIKDMSIFLPFYKKGGIGWQKMGIL